MPTAIDATVGGAASNSYTTLAYITQYWEDSLYGAPWTDATPEQQTQAALEATRRLETYLVWYGTKATAAQALAHPRLGLVDRHGEPIPSTAIATEVTEAQAELCKYLLAGDRLSDSQATVTAISTPAVSLSLNAAARPAVLPDIVAALLAPVGCVQGRQALQVNTLRV
jgi:hypothetical protein